MLPYDPHQSRSRDYTKTRIYIALDLAVKMLSALGLVVIGAAGWMLQHDTHKQRAKTEQSDRLSRKYLPVYRTFTDLELMLQDCTEELVAIEQSQSRAEALRQLSYELETVAVSSFATERDPIARIDLPLLASDADNASREPIVSKNLSVRSTGFMVADILRLAAAIEATPQTPQTANAGVQFRLLLNRPLAVVLLPVPAYDKNGREVTNPRVVVPAAAIYARSEALAAWRAWNGDGVIPADHLMRALIPLTQAAHQQAVEAIQTITRENPELGDQFVTLRRDAVAERNARSESRRRIIASDRATKTAGLAIDPRIIAKH
ncbi:MAG: hypothetical protein ACXW5U_25025 [Thermoanaerobaculia bacterium]